MNSDAINLNFAAFILAGVAISSAALGVASERLYQWLKRPTRNRLTQGLSGWF